MTTDNPESGQETRARRARRSERDDADEVTFPYQQLPLARMAHALGTLCLVAILVPFLIFAVPQTVGADHGFVILSGSMEPELSPGDVVIVADGQSARVGDVITFTNGGSVPITHRVVAVEDGQYVTKGDANENIDSEPVAPSAVVGRVVYTIPAIGHVIIWANTPVGQFALVVVPLVLLGASTLARWSQDEPASDAPAETDVMDDATALAAMFDGLDVDPAMAGTEPAKDRETPVTESDQTVTVAAPDLKLTLVAAAVTCSYAGWNVSRELSTVGAPNPVSIAVGTAGLLGVLFAVWTLLDNRRRRSSDGAVEPTTAADGGVDLEDKL